MTHLEKNNEIDNEAARWAARVDREPLSPKDQLALDAWLAADVRHLGAYAKAQAIFAHMDRARALGTGFDPQRFVEAEAVKSPTRRRAIQIGVAAAALACVAIPVLRRSQKSTQTVSTQRGETRVVPLEDGSVVTLNTATRVAIFYTRERRHVQLQAGEALFDVAKDPRRLFTVSANETQVRAVGTSFTVRLMPQQVVKVLVREGIVEMKSAVLPAAPAVLVPANTQALAPVNAPIAAEAIPQREVDRELTWRVGRIAFEGESLREAVEMFARYSDTRIVIDDPAIAERTITGLFVSNDPVGFSRAVAISLNLRADVGDGEVRLSR